MKKTNKYELSIVFLFCIMIGGMFLFSIFSGKLDYSVYERRYLAEFPKMSLKTIGSGAFGSEFESYLSDHFTGRSFFVGTNAYYNLAMGRNGSNGIYSTKEGYLIEKPETDSMKTIEKNLKRIADFTAKQRCKSDIMLVPYTGYVLNDTLPLTAAHYYDDKAFDMVKSQNSSLRLIDLRNSFKQKSKEEQLYFKTDHHWTTAGAYAAYLEYCKYIGVEAKPLHYFTVDAFPGFFGTTYARSCQWFSKSDRIELWESKNTHRMSFKVFDDDVTHNRLFFKENLSGNDPYSVFLDGNLGFTKIHNPDVKKGRLLIIKDSFAQCFAPFLAHHYRDIYLVDLRHYREPVSLILSKYGINHILVLYGMNTFSKDENLTWLNR